MMRDDFFIMDETSNGFCAWPDREGLSRFRLAARDFNDLVIGFGIDAGLDDEDFLRLDIPKTKDLLSE